MEGMMMEFGRLGRLLLIGAAVVIVVAGMRAFAEPLSAFLLAALIAVLCAPLRNSLMRRGWSQGASLALVLALVIGIGVALVVFVGVSANQLIRALPRYEAQVQVLEGQITTQIEALGLREQATEAIETFDPTSLFPLASGVLGAVGNSLGNVLLVFLILVYMLVDAPNIPRRLRAALPEDSRWLDKAALFFGSVQRYMILRTVFGAVIAFVQTVVMLIIGVDFAVQWGVLSVITNYIPNIGFVLGVIPPVAVTLLEKGLLMAGVLLVLYSVINNVIESLIAPRFMAEDLGISSLSIFLSLIFWTWVLGPAGALLAVPMSLAVKIMLLDGEAELKGVVAVVSEK
jgi:predicted PurR-regulated permease PerM